MITVLGSINIDLIATAERLPQAGETIAGNSLVTAAGGKGANQALAARRAGAVTAMVGATGDDTFAGPALANLNAAGVELEWVRVTEQPTGTAMIVVDAAGENIITVVAGANGEVTDEDAAIAVESMNAGDTLLMQLEIPETVVATACRLAREKKIRSVVNTAPLTAKAQSLARLADVVVANESEFAGLTENTSSSRESLKSHMVNFSNDGERALVVTLGRDGALAAFNNQWFETKALEITAIDTVGAGDTFCGYLAHALDSAVDFEQALIRATVAGSLACLVPGAQSAVPSEQQVLDALR